MIMDLIKDQHLGKFELKNLRGEILNHHIVTGKVRLANQFYDIEGESLYFHLKIKTANH